MCIWASHYIDIWASYYITIWASDYMTVWASGQFQFNVPKRGLMTIVLNGNVLGAHPCRHRIALYFRFCLRFEWQHNWRCLLIVSQFSFTFVFALGGSTTGAVFPSYRNLVSFLFSLWGGSTTGAVFPSYLNLVSFLSSLWVAAQLALSSHRIAI